MALRLGGYPRRKRGALREEIIGKLLPPNDMAYSYTWTVRTGDTDFSGLIYTPTVIDHVVRGMEELMAEIEFSPSAAQERGLLYPAVHAEADYVDSFGVDDIVTVALVPHVGDASIELAARGTLDDELVFTAELTLVCTDAASGESTPVPLDIRDRLEQYAE
jgi:acyl-CoA thioesterase FadM